MRRLAALLVTVLVGVIALGALVWLVQRPMLYVGGGGAPGQPPADLEADDVRLTTADGLALDAWWVEPGDGSLQAAAIAFPGNAGTRAARAPLAHMLVDAGVGVLLVDYRGYADNPGRPSEPGLRRDARAARDWLDAHLDGRDEDVPVLYLGESLGAAVAAGLASERPPDGLLLRSPFPSLARAAGAVYGLPRLPRLVLRDRYPVAAQVAALPEAVAVEVLADATDRIVPVELSAEVAAAADVEPVVIDGDGHNDPAWLDGPAMREAVRRLLHAVAER